MKSKGCGYVENEISRNMFVWVAFKQNKLDKPNQHLEEELFIIFILKLYHEVCGHERYGEKTGKSNRWNIRNSFLSLVPVWVATLARQKLLMNYAWSRSQLLLHYGVMWDGGKLWLYYGQQWFVNQFVFLYIGMKSWYILGMNHIPI